MEPVLKLDQFMEVELEGWVLKRGAGFNEEDDPKREPNSKLQNLFRKQFKARYLVLVKNNVNPNVRRSTATIHYYSKKPKVIKERAHAELKTLNLKLARIPNSGLSKGAKETATTPETTTGLSVGSQLHKKGEIDLNEHTRVMLKDGVIILKCTGRTYYFKSRESKKSAAEISFDVGKWYEGILKVIIWVKNAEMGSRRGFNNDHLQRLSVAYNRQSSEYDGTTIRRRKSSVDFTNLEQNIPDSLESILEQPFYRKEFRDFLVFAQATENLDFCDKVREFRAQAARLKNVSNQKTDISSFVASVYKEYISQESPRQVNISSEQRREIQRVMKEEKQAPATIFDEAEAEILLLLETNFFHRFYSDLLKRTGCFASLLHQCGLPGYDAIIQNHFGSVMAETERLISMYEGRLTAVESQIAALTESLRYSHEVAVPVFKTLRKSIRSVYNSSLVRIEALDTFKTELQDNCIVRLKDLVTTLSQKINEILQEDRKQIAAWKVLSDTHDQCGLLERTLRMHGRMVEQNAETLEKAGEALSKFKIKITAGTNFNELITEAAAATEAAKHKERATYKDLTDSLSDSLNYLEKMDLHRLGEQQEAMKALLVAENDLFRSMAEDVQASSGVIAKIDVKSDQDNFENALKEALAQDILYL